MKNTIKGILAFIFALVFALTLVSCNKNNVYVWENAIYLEDTELGVGAKTITVEVKAQERTVIFTVRTDKSTVGEALLEHGLISGKQGQFGMYIKSVNGIVADYDTDGYYWGFYINGEYAMTGVDTTEILEGDTYCLERTK